MKTLIDLITLLGNRKPYELFSYKNHYRTFRYQSDEVFTAIKQFSGFLHRQKIKKGDRIMIWGANSPEWVLAFLGCIWHGAIVIPIDERQNAAFVKTIHKQVNAKLLFKSAYKEDALKQTIALEGLFDHIADAPQKASATIAKDDIVQILYTSGTTGVPKGVPLTHQNIVSNILGIQHAIIMKPSYTFFSLLPLSHIFEQTAGLFMPLHYGSRVVYSYSRKPSILMSTIKKEKIAVMLVVPQFLDILRQRIQEKTTRTGFFTTQAIQSKFGRSFRYFVVGGAPLEKELEEYWSALGFTLLQGYGLTETSPVLTLNTPTTKRIGSVGKPLPGTLVKIAQDGEVLCKGPNVFGGYYKRKDKIFTDGWFMTGDLGEFDKDGFLFLKGRKKDMIVTAAGVNVYPEDIENTINKIKGVKDSCIIGVKEKKGEEVHAVLLLSKGINAKSVIIEANKQLDSAQQITNYTVWSEEDFPRTTTLKIKKFVVKEQLKKKKTPTKVKQTTKLAETIAKITTVPNKIKRNATLGVDLKLSSIDRVELATLLEDAFHIDLDENLLTSTVTVKQLDTIIKQQKKQTEHTKIRRYALSFPIRVVRFIVQWPLLGIIRLFVRTTVYGKEHLKGLDGPVVFVSNHQSHFDAGVLLSILPLRFSTKTAIATWAEYFTKKKGDWRGNLYKWFMIYFATIAGNAYLMPQIKNPRESLEYTGELLDKGWNILFFPEGERSTDGAMVPFKPGIGLIGRAMRVTIVPFKIRGLFEILPLTRHWPKAGNATVTIGTPMHFSTTDSVVDITNAVEKAVQNL